MGWKHTNERGVALILVLGLVIIIAAVALIIAGISIVERGLTASERQQKQAFDAAEAGLEHMIALLPDSLFGVCDTVWFGQTMAVMWNGSHTDTMPGKRPVTSTQFTPPGSEEIGGNRRIVYHRFSIRASGRLYVLGANPTAPQRWANKELSIGALDIGPDVITP